MVTVTCTATAKATGARCRRSPVAGATVCVVHGGAAPQVKAAAKERLAAGAATRLGLPVETTAAEALQDGLARLNGEVLWLQERVSQIPEDELTWEMAARRIRPSSEPGGQASVEVEHRTRKHVLWVALDDAIARRSAIAAEMARLGIEARQARVLELVGARLADGLDRALAGAGVPVSQRAKVLQLLPGALNSGESG